MADPATDAICVDGRPLAAWTPRLYLLLNKPTGYVTTVRDRHAEHTVMELVGNVPSRVYPVGRLDRDTAGLLILTDDGDFAQRMAHPGHGVPKTYRAVVRGEVGARTLSALGRGVALGDGPHAFAEVGDVQVDAARNVTALDLTIREGRNRQVRKMLASVGHPVLALTRTRIGSLRLTGLAPGTWRKLRPREVEALLAESTQTRSASKPSGRIARPKGPADIEAGGPPAGPARGSRRADGVRARKGGAAIEAGGPPAGAARGSRRADGVRARQGGAAIEAGGPPAGPARGSRRADGVRARKGGAAIEAGGP
ncbi:MAG TPA: pseudouridine synthase, partial [Chthonomonadales bacterium]|nr:pseudouridine synthase [Chthonomonadales bacterium]